MKLLAGFFCIVISQVQCRILDYCECGIGNKDELALRIISGTVAFPHSFPWMVYLWHKRNEVSFCGGAIINDQFILTAAHCLYQMKENNVIVRVGAHDVQVKDGTGMAVGKFIIHEQYTRFVEYDINDMGLIKTKSRIQFSSTVLPICLPNPKSVYIMKTAIISGWGTTEKGIASRYLRHSNVRVISEEECEHVIKIGTKVVPGSNFCAYSYQTDTCQGDSGSPIIYEATTYKYEIIGIVSWGQGCATEGVPGIYMNVTYFLDWIRTNTAGSNYCKVSS